MKQGFLGIKAAMVIHVDIELSGQSRKPLPPVTEVVVDELRHGLAKVVAFEKSIS